MGPKIAKRKAVRYEREFNSLLGERLMKLRKERSISQVEIGSILEIHQSAICRIESGDQTLTPYQLTALSLLYKMKVDDLLQVGSARSSRTKK